MIRSSVLIRSLASLGVALMCLPARGQSGQPVTPVLTNSFATNGLAQVFSNLHANILYHVAKYAPRPLTWVQLAEPKNVRAVYPHPEIPATVYAVSDDGVYRSDNYAATWRRLPLAGFAGAGEVTAVAFRPADPDTFCLGTRSDGIWLTRDGGGTARRLGSKADGMASDSIACLAFDHGDRFRRRVVAGHGREAAGISRGDIEKGAWEVLVRNYHVYRLIPCELVNRNNGDVTARDFYVFAAVAADPEKVELYYAPILDVPWRRLLDGATPTDAQWFFQTTIFSIQSRMCVTTLDRGVFLVDARAGTQTSLGGDEHEWFSVCSTWGSHADESVLGLYQPAGRGFAMVVGANPLSNAVNQSGSLYRGEFVSEGSHIRAGAGGTRFYGAINGGLWVGLRNNPFRVDSVEVTPSSVLVNGTAVVDEPQWGALRGELQGFARAATAAPLAGDLVKTLRPLNRAVPDVKVQVLARVVAPTGVAVTVTADLSRFGGLPETPMTATNDGKYVVSFPLYRDGIAHREWEWRSTWPGPMPISVTARVPGRDPVGSVGLLYLRDRPDSFYVWRRGAGLGVQNLSGTAGVKFVEDPAKAACGSWYIQLDAGPGPWQVSLGSWPSYGFLFAFPDIAYYDALTFLIRSDGPADPELSVSLADNPNGSEPVTTPPVRLVAGGYVAGGGLSDKEYRRVVIPVADLLKGAPGFVPGQFGWVVLSGDSAAKRTYLINEIRFVVSRKELEP